MWDDLVKQMRLGKVERDALISIAGGVRYSVHLAVAASMRPSAAQGVQWQFPSFLHKRPLG